MFQDGETVQAKEMASEKDLLDIEDLFNLQGRNWSIWRQRTLQLQEGKLLMRDIAITGVLAPSPDLWNSANFTSWQILFSNFKEE